jgi:hypothetical protein
MIKSHLFVLKLTVLVDILQLNDYLWHFENLHVCLSRRDIGQHQLLQNNSILPNIFG